MDKLTNDDIQFSTVVEGLHDIDKWILSRYNTVVKQATEFMNNFQFDKTRKIVVEFIWHELADHYLELVKHRIYDPKDKIISCILYQLGLGIIKMIAPLLPHVTEEIYQRYYFRFDVCKSIHQSSWPELIFEDKQGEIDGRLLKDFIRELRHWKSENGIPLNTELNYVGIICENQKNRMILERNQADIIATIKAKKFEFLDDTGTEVSVRSIKPVYSVLGPEFKDKSKEIISKLQALSPQSIYDQLTATGHYDLELEGGDKIKLPLLPEWIERWNWKVSVTIIVISNILKDYLVRKGVPEKKITVIPNGADPNKFKPGLNGKSLRIQYDQQDQVVIGWMIGWIESSSRGSDLENLLCMSKKILAMYKNISFLFVGCGKNKEIIEIISRNFYNFIIFL